LFLLQADANSKSIVLTKSDSYKNGSEAIDMKISIK
jgi:hypothetical protein